MTTPIEKVVAAMLSQDGDAYVFGAEASVDDANPTAFDCSELVQWACGRAGVTPTMPDGSWYQARHCKGNGTLFEADAIGDAITTRGALLFRFSSSPFEGARPSSAHVAMSLGDGTTIEARSSTHGVGQFSALGRGWTHAGLVPGCEYVTAPPSYRDVLNVPDEPWARNVIDRHLERGVIVTSDTFVDDWARVAPSDGRAWTILDRALRALEVRIDELESELATLKEEA